MASSVSCVASGSDYPHIGQLQVQVPGMGGGDRNRVIGELSRGREMADRLRQVLRQTGGTGLQNLSALDLDPSPAHVTAIVAKILDTFTQSISILTAGAAASQHIDAASDEFSNDILVAPAPLIDSPAEPAARKLEGSGDSCKATTRKDRRGCHKRKRNTETRTEDSPTWPEDRFAWRKYGQKVILNAKHPRNYFRCTHKYDEGCPATKQVQKIQDDPPVFRATYHAHHTCTTTRTSTSSSSLGFSYPAEQNHSSSTTIWSFFQQQPAINSHPTAAPAPAPAPAAVIKIKPNTFNNSAAGLHDVSGSGAGSNPSGGGGAIALEEDTTCATPANTTGHQLPPPHAHAVAAAYSMSGGSDQQHGHGGGDVYSCTASSSTHQTAIEMDITINSIMSLDDLLDTIIDH